MKSAPHVVAPVATSICGTFFELRYGRVARLTSVPSEPTTAKTLSCSTRPRVSCTAWAGE